MANVLRLSQLISTFGSGAMVDLPTRSVIISGLDHWEVRDPKTSPIINEPRLQRLLERSMREVGRLPPNQSITLRKPPVNLELQSFGDPPSVDAMVFPATFLCDHIENSGSNVRRRLLVTWPQLDSASSKRKYKMPDTDKLTGVSPIRFVGACDDGHIEDIDWRWAIHQQSDLCSKPLYLEERGTSGSPADTAVVCECGKRITLVDINIPGRLGNCKGRRPWLGRDNKEPCKNKIKLLTRTATNTYFPQVATVISLPQGSDALAKAVDGTWENLSNIESFEQLRLVAKIIPAVTGALSGLDLADCFSHIQARQRDEIANGNASPRIAEFDLLASGRPEIGQPGRDSRLFATTLPRQAWETKALPFVRNIVAVHRLREVSCLYGFTRFEPAATLDDDVEEVRLAVSGAPIAENLEWLPAIEQFGEGIFVHVNPDTLADWSSEPRVKARAIQLLAGYAKWQSGAPVRGKLKFPGLAYVLLHSLSHALMIEIALESGYPASSIKERIYAIEVPEDGQDTKRFGILIYTASTGAQGTLGGLVGSAARIVQIFESALARINVCSNDPICADHNPASTNGDRNLHGAACHGCLLVAETSCEKRNEFLDRALLIETMAMNGAALFP